MEFQTNLIQSILGWRRLKVLEILTIQSSKRRSRVFLSKSTLWYNYCFGQMCLLIWTGFSSERCNPWTCCFHFRQCETLSSWTLQTSDKWQHLLSTFQVSFCLLVCHFKLFETWFYLITQVSYLNQSFYLFKVSRRIHSRYTRNKCYRYNMQEGSPHNFNYISANTVYLTLRLDYQGLPSFLMSLDWLGVSIAVVLWISVKTFG